MRTNSLSAVKAADLLGRVFQSLYEEGAHTLEFDDQLIRAHASRPDLALIERDFQLHDSICYDRGVANSELALLPSSVRMTEPEGWQWRVYRISKDAYAFRLERIDSIHPSRLLLQEARILDATPRIVGRNAVSKQQSLLAKIRHNRLIDIFLGITAYSLPNHLRTTVKGLGQIEIDEVYVGVDRFGCQYIIPVQAKGGSDQLSTVQAKQDIACCAQKFPKLVCRAISAQFMDDSKIALFELCLDEHGLVKIAEERHYQLVPSEKIGAADLQAYRSRAGC